MKSLHSTPYHRLDINIRTTTIMTATTTSYLRW